MITAVVLCACNTKHKYTITIKEHSGMFSSIADDVIDEQTEKFESDEEAYGRGFGRLCTFVASRCNREPSFNPYFYYVVVTNEDGVEIDKSVLSFTQGCAALYTIKDYRDRLEQGKAEFPELASYWPDLDDF